MKRTNILTVICTMCLLAASAVQAQRDYGSHDPCNIVKDGDTYFTFMTGPGVQCAYSTDLCTWRRGQQLFPTTNWPSWINQYVRLTGEDPFNGHMWAPEVFFMNGRWHVYYSCSSFGDRGSAIGLATSPSLKNPQWTDHGMVVYTTNSSNHNAIDPDVFRATDGRVYMTYGSFWSGIVITELDTVSGKAKDRNNLTYIANGDPEAPAIIHRGNYYYLFFNRGACCRGVNSTYKIYVGRSTSPTGPFTDKNGVKTSERGGTLLLEAWDRFIGPGHFGYFAENGREYMSYFYYDKNQNGAFKLKISTLSWQNDWPVVNKDFDPCNAPPIKDCAGVDNGTAYLDNCNTCVGGTTGKQPCVQDCNGDWGGSATTDQCGVCVGGNTGSVACSGSLQADESSEYDGVMESVNSGYTGSGYFNFTNAVGSYGSWNICSDNASSALLVFRYANGSTANRNLSVSVNGIVQVSNLEIPSTGAWTTWKSASVSLQLQKGSNKITLNSLSSEGGPNIDVITYSDASLHKCLATGINRTPLVKRTQLKLKNGIVSFYLEKESSVDLRIYTVSGRLVETLFSGKANAGINNFTINSKITAGTYLLVLENGITVKQQQFIIAP